MGLEFLVTRERFEKASDGREGFTLGTMSLNGAFFCYTLEDQDRRLEENPKGKVYGVTAIPRGRYRLTLTHSPKFGRPMPLVNDVPGFSGIRLHGANDASELLGCIALGQILKPRGVASCAPVVQRVIDLLREADSRDCWITVR